jgi:sugar O-acyltransferase (sialic acid O-acetyltransferase NeuD family)
MIRHGKKGIILGAGGHCRILLSILLEPANRDYFIEGILDTQQVTANESILDVKIIGTVDKLGDFFNEGIKVLFLALGDNQQRARYYQLAKTIGYELPNLVADGAYIAPTATIGEGNLLCHRSHMGPMSRIGNANILNTGSILEHESTIGDFCHLAPSAVVSGRSHIGNNVFLGVNSTVIDKINICDKVTVGAGAVVVKDITGPEETYVGVPAKRLK